MCLFPLEKWNKWKVFFFNLVTSVPEPFHFSLPDPFQWNKLQKPAKNNIYQNLIIFLLLIQNKLSTFSILGRIQSRMRLCFSTIWSRIKMKLTRNTANYSNKKNGIQREKLKTKITNPGLEMRPWFLLDETLT